MRKFGWGSAVARAALLAGLAMAQPAWADVKAGVDAWQRGDYKAAIAQWRAPAVAGDADAQFNMGQAYKLGRGVAVDMAMAEEWYRKAALQGHVQAQDNYGLALFQNGKKQEAQTWLDRSASRGEARAQYLLGAMLFNGDGVPKNWVKAYALMVRSAASGLPQGTQTLAQMDRYIPADQRQQGLALSRQMEADAQRTQLAGTAPPAATPPATRSSPPVRRTDLPPSGALDPEPQPEAPPRVRRDPPPPMVVPRPRAETPPPVRREPELPPAPEVRPAPVKRPAPAARPAPVTRPAPAPRAAAVPSPARAGRGWRVQLGAFRDRSNADSLWRSLSGRVGALRSAQPYMVTAGAITRLQVGPFASSAEANRVCAQVKRTGTACVPVAP